MTLSVSTTGVNADEVTLVRDALARRGLIYSSDLTTRTSLLIASTPKSQKYQEARRVGIPIVSLQWVKDADCDPERVPSFEVRDALFGKIVCTTGLTERQRQSVQCLCQKEHAVYETSLSRHCHWLVVSDELQQSATGNEKTVFAARYGIRQEGYRQFLRTHGFVDSEESKTTTTTAAAERRSTSAASAPLPRNRDGAPLSSSSSISSLAHDFSSVCCYLFPPALVTAAIRSVLAALGIQRRPTLTSDVTHVLCIGPAPYDALAIPISCRSAHLVAWAWIAASIEAKRRLPEEGYAVLLPRVPTLTFGSMEKGAKDRLTERLAASPLSYRLQDVLVVGTVVTPVKEQKNNKEGGGGDDNEEPLTTTTHLVVPASMQGASSKVQAVLERRKRTKRTECLVVDPCWIEASIAAGRWVEEGSSLAPLVAKNTTTITRDLPNAGVDGVAEGKEVLEGTRAAPASAAVPPPPVTPTMMLSSPCVGSGPHPKKSVVDVDEEEINEDAEQSQHCSRTARLTLDSQSLNQSLEALIGRLEQKQSNSNNINPHPPHATATTTIGPSIAAGFEPLLATVVGGGPSPVVASAGPPPHALLPPPPPLRSASPLVLQSSSLPHFPSSLQPAAAAGSGAGGGGTLLWERSLSPFDYNKSTSPLAMVGPSFALFSSATAAAPAAAAAHSAAESQTIVYGCLSSSSTEAHHDSKATTATGGGGATLWSVPPPLAPTSSSSSHRCEGAPPRVVCLLAKGVREDPTHRETVLALHGEVLELYQDTCTHYIVAKPSKTETFLMALASGKWVLHPSYLADCARANQFLPEAPYEWAVVPERHQLGNSAATLAAGCQLQRVRGGNAFRSWKAIVCCDTVARGESFARVLRAGGCSALEVVSAPRSVWWGDAQRSRQLAAEGSSSSEGMVGATPTHILIDDNMYQAETLSAMSAAFLAPSTGTGGGGGAHSGASAVPWLLKMEYIVHTLCNEIPRPQLFDLRTTNAVPAVVGGGPPLKRPREES